MESAGFVLAGGESTRMGRDKALLSYRGRTLVEVIASTVQEAAGTAAIIGDPGRYGYTSFPVYPDRVARCGPMGGLFTALSVTLSDWNLVVACDMPKLSAEMLKSLIGRASESAAECVVATAPGGQWYPLCAVYHRRCLPAVDRAIRERRLKMQDLFAELRAITMVSNPADLANINTPKEWLQFEDRPA